MSMSQQISKYGNSKVGILKGKKLISTYGEFERAKNGQANDVMDIWREGNLWSRLVAKKPRAKKILP